MKRTTIGIWMTAVLLAVPRAPLHAQRVPGAQRPPRLPQDAEVAAALASADAALAALPALMPEVAAVPFSFAEARWATPLALAEAQLATLPSLAWADAQLAAMPGLAMLEWPVARVVAPAPWLQQDPADSVYRAARDALNRREFERAADLFASIRLRYPRSGYVPDSYYFQAFALQRQGGREAQQKAISLLDEQRQNHPKANTRGDADQLRARLVGARAQAGDARSAAAVETAASVACERSDQELKATALSALMSMDSQRALPILKEILQDRDECSVQLRRQAVFLVARASGDQAVDVMLDLAQRNPDPDPEVRSQAVFWLSRVQTPEAVAALEGILQQSTDPTIQTQAVFALSRQGSPRALQVLKGYAERAGAPKEARQQAIYWLGRDAANGGPAYLRSLYPKLETTDLKEQVLTAIAASGGAEDRAWLLERVKDANESVDVRKAALYWAGKDGGVSVADLRALYGQIDDRDVREQAIFVLSRSDQAEAVDALMDIATKETDRELRQQAVFWLGKSNDPRVADFLLKLIRGNR